MARPEEKLFQKNPLIAWYEADPAGWLPYSYGGFTDLKVEADSTGRIAVRTINAPFMWTKVVHTIVGNIEDPQTSGLYNDGQYLMGVRDERRNFTDTPIPADLFAGPRKQGDFPDLDFPIFFPSNHTIRFELVNIYTRILTPESDVFRIWVGVRGMHYWGDLKPPEALLKYSRGQV